MCRYMYSLRGVYVSFFFLFLEILLNSCVDLLLYLTKCTDIYVSVKGNMYIYDCEAICARVQAHSWKYLLRFNTSNYL